MGERGDRLEMLVAGENHGGALAAPSVDAGIAVGRVADEREQVGYRARTDAELRHDTRLVGDGAVAAVHPDDVRPHDALSKVLVGRADVDFLHTRV